LFFAPLITEHANLADILGAYFEIAALIVGHAFDAALGRGVANADTRAGIAGAHAAILGARFCAVAEVAVVGAGRCTGNARSIRTGFDAVADDAVVAIDVVVATRDAAFARLIASASTRWRSADALPINAALNAGAEDGVVAIVVDDTRDACVGVFIACGIARAFFTDARAVDAEFEAVAEEIVFAIGVAATCDET
jgi:hypothetical protein